MRQGVFGEFGPGRAFPRAPRDPVRARPGHASSVALMELTARQLNRATLARQLLLERQALPVVEGVRRVVAVQAQEPASPYVALWNRLAGFDPADLDSAFTDHAVVKASLLRLTLHAVAADDHPAFHAAMLPNLRASRLGDQRYTGTGLTVADADAAIGELRTFLAVPRTKDEIDAQLVARHGPERSTWLWWALRTFAPLWHVPTGPPWSFGRRKSYRAVPPPTGQAPGHEAAVQHLVVRYLEGFGPASVADIGQFTLLQRGKVRTAIEALGARLTTHTGPDGKTLYDVPDGPLPAEVTPAPPRLLGMWDSVVLAYFDRSRVVPDAHRSLVTRRNGDVLPTLLVDGYVRGVWRPVDGRIEATAFEPLPADAWDGLGEEAVRLQAFLADRDPATYGRYRHWWDKLPAGDTRVLAG